MIHHLLYNFMSGFPFELVTYIYVYIYIFLHVNRSEVNNVVHTLHVTSLTAPLYRNLGLLRSSHVKNLGRANNGEQRQPSPPPPPDPSVHLLRLRCASSCLITYSVVPVLCYCHRCEDVANKGTVWFSQKVSFLFKRFKAPTLNL